MSMEKWPQWEIKQSWCQSWSDAHIAETSSCSGGSVLSWSVTVVTISRWPIWSTWMWTRWARRRQWHGSTRRSSKSSLNFPIDKSLNQTCKKHKTRFLQVSSPVQGVCYSLKRIGGKWRPGNKVTTIGCSLWIGASEWNYWRQYCPVL